MSDETTRLKLGRRLVWILAGTLCWVLLTAGCSTATKRKWVVFFFDGVPSEESMTNKPAAKPIAKTPGKSVIPAYLLATKTNRGPGTIHLPYAQNKCEKCHERATSTVITDQPQLTLCFSCHKDFLPALKVKHQPVVTGQCSRCHSPHESPNPKLLLKKGNLLCLTCHDPLSKGPVKHQAVASGNCLDCHLPHGGTNQFLAKLPGKALCFECHDDFGAKAKYTHAPAESGDCAACHDPHASKSKRLLKREGGEVCYSCHDDFQARLKSAKVTHPPAQNGECIACHNSHASNQKFLLTKPVAALCRDCHEDKDIQAVPAHAGTGNKSCVDCHESHTSQEKKLLKAGVKTAATRP